MCVQRVQLYTKNISYVLFFIIGTFHCCRLEFVRSSYFKANAGKHILSYKFEDTKHQHFLFNPISC